jgi:alginate O-acetyltransferase complex protein AlgI
MLFNSFEFALFFPFVFAVYWALQNKGYKYQNIFLLVMSYFFYSCWNYRFLALLAFSTWLDFFTGIKIEDAKTDKEKKMWLMISVITNLGFLGFFKYFNFFIESAASFISLFGLKPHIWTLNIILPVGISFYTFHGLSYVLDIYKGRIKANRNVIDYSLFVSFFPLLVAGPIERATHLLPQIVKKREFDYFKASDGVRQIVWGLFKKIVIADNCAVFVNDIFANYSTQPGSILFLGAALFAFQVYGDFSGYSDIAIGCAKLLGIDLLTNFRTPYFSTNFGEFWRKWHISLSSWILDYVYNPLSISFRNWKQNGVILTLVLTFTLNGLWHGASWHFVVFGLLMGMALGFEALTKKIRKRIRKATPTQLYFWGSCIITFIVWCFFCVLFRATSLGHAFGYYKGIFTNKFLPPHLSDFVLYKFVFFQIGILMVFDWIFRNEEHNFTLHKIQNPFFRRSIYFVFLFLLLVFAGKQKEFIYFQF